MQSFEIVYNPKAKILFLGAKVKKHHLQRFKKQIDFLKQYASINNKTCNLNLQTC